MRIFYSENIDSLRLPDEEAQHASRVLRSKLGDLISIVDGKGRKATAKITEIDKRKCFYEIVDSTIEQNTVDHLEIAIAPTKSNDRLEWMIEKLCEIGIGKIHLVFTTRTEKNRLKQDRLFKKVVSACKQSQKAHFPKILIHEKYNEFIDSSISNTKLIAHLEKEERIYVANALNKNQGTIILIGPEGDFTPEEIETAKQNGFKSVTLGDFRLRTETAAVFAGTILNNTRYIL